MHRLKEAGLHSMSEDPAAAVDTSTPAAKTLWPTSSNSRRERMSISSATAEAEAVTKVYDKDPGAAVVGVWESAITADAGGPDHGVLTT
eukprot:CAMPEP_0177778970 /NCGR_PEP_ID=MMETSP0491_2-20121128/16283_1 /TAXON_ID=63592 /ORGANISM="Tetraselmis chuii, Strain PLY429" /LENGTH=88 /DNA_ID=CAMNT_0019298369 /DNA_START=391 /DNA_END=653 /DNA_ORIENTATION=+